VAVLAVVLQRAEGHAPGLGKLAHAFDTAYWCRWELRARPHPVRALLRASARAPA